MNIYNTNKISASDMIKFHRQAYLGNLHYAEEAMVLSKNLCSELYEFNQVVRDMSAIEEKLKLNESGHIKMKKSEVKEYRLKLEELRIRSVNKWERIESAKQALDNFHKPNTVSKS